MNVNKTLWGFTSYTLGVFAAGIVIGGVYGAIKGYQVGRAVEEAVNDKKEQAVVVDAEVLEKD